jgi:two-component system sensor histidine kinase BarA
MPRLRPLPLPPFGFAARLGLAVSALIAVVCVVQSWILAQRDLAHLRGFLIERGRTVSQQLAAEAGPPMFAGNLEALRRLAYRARGESGVAYTRFFDRDGLLLVATGAATADSVPPQAAARGEAIGPLPVGADIWEFQAPIAPSGTVAIGLSLEPLQALRRRALTTATLFTTLFTLLAIAAAVALAGAITQPLHTLAAAADAIARGDFGAKVEVTTHDEIGRLAGSFNAMVESLTASRAALEEKVEELAKANRLKSEFLATVSHELRTPLNVIIGYAEMLAESGDLAEKQEEMVAAIRRYSTLQLDLITNVLDFSRLSAGRVSCHVERFALAPLLAEIQALHGARLASPRLALAVAADPGLPMLETDRVKLQEVVHNLVDNAIKFTDAGTVAVSARPAADPAWVTLEVRDTGAGIPPEDLEHVFDPFHQSGTSSTRRTGGVGLGLSIVQQLVTALGGTVSVSSRVGEGSTFRVEIPCSLLEPGRAPAAEGELPLARAVLDEVTRNAAALPRRVSTRSGTRRGARAARKATS